MLGISALLAIKTLTLVLIIGGALFGIAIITAIVMVFMPKNKEKNVVSDVVEKGNVRYTESQQVVDDNGNMHVSLGQKDIILKQGATYIVGKEKEIKPGKYTVLGSAQNEEKFNLRIGLYVKEYSHNQEVILADGDEISPVSTNVILR